MKILHELFNFDPVDKFIILTNLYRAALSEYVTDPQLKIILSASSQCSHSPTYFRLLQKLLHACISLKYTLNKNNIDNISQNEIHPACNDYLHISCGINDELFNDKIGKIEFENFSVISEMKEKLFNAMHFIKNIDPMQFMRIQKLINTIFLIKSDSIECHRSFSPYYYPGAIFMSNSNYEYAIIEALIHEFAHNELNIFMEFSNITLINNNDALYYSPWRNDLRPLYGILHAIYVFTAVCGFYSKLPLSYWHQDRLKILKDKLHMAVTQIEAGDLTDEGSYLLDKLWYHCIGEP